MKITKNKVEFTETMAAIENMNALAKIICSPVHNDISWESLLSQLQDPGSNRPVKSVNELEIDRTQLFNPKTRKWGTRVLQGARGEAKETDYTKKTSTTLIPMDGKIQFWQPVDPDLKLRATIGLVFDLEDCDLRDEKYVFNTGVSTHGRPWLKRKGTDETNCPESVSLEDLRNEISEKRRRGQIPNYNEILARLTRDALIGVFTREDTLAERLNALLKKRLIKERLNKDVPILIITTENGVKHYAELDIMNDLAEVLFQGPSHPAYSIANALRKNQKITTDNTNTIDKLMRSIVTHEASHPKADVFLSHYIREYLKKQNDGAFINEAVFQLAKLNKVIANQILFEALNSEDENYDLIIMFIKQKIILDSDQMIKMIAKNINYKKWVNLLSELCRPDQDDDIKKIIMNDYANNSKLEVVLNSLVSIEKKISRQNPDDPIIEESKKIRTQILIQNLKEPGNRTYKRQEKNLINDYFHKEINKINDEEELNKFQKYTSSLMEDGDHKITLCCCSLIVIPLSMIVGGMIIGYMPLAFLVSLAGLATSFALYYSAVNVINTRNTLVLAINNQRSYLKSKKENTVLQGEHIKTGTQVSSTPIASSPDVLIKGSLEVKPSTTVANITTPNNLYPVADGSPRQNASLGLGNNSSSFYYSPPAFPSYESTASSTRTPQSGSWFSSIFSRRGYD